MQFWLTTPLSIVSALFSQVGKKTRSNIHTLARVSPTPILYQREELRAIRAIFGPFAQQLLVADQTYGNLKAGTTKLFHHMSPLLKMPSELNSVALWTLCAYTVLLAPWSAVKLRVPRMGPSNNKSFAIFAARDLKENELIYELPGLLSMDIADIAHQTNLSVVTLPGRNSKHILFGPIRLVNHGCQANVEFVHLTHTSDMHAMTIRTNRAIQKDEQLFVADEAPTDVKPTDVKCSCAACHPPSVHSCAPGAGGKTEVRIGAMPMDTVDRNSENSSAPDSDQPIAEPCKPSTEAARRRRQRQRDWEKVDPPKLEHTPVRVIVDLSLGQLKDQESKSFCGQLSQVYNRNRKVGKPFALVLASPDGETIARLSEDQQCKHWKNEVQWRADDCGRLWDDTTESLVHLTANSGEELTELKQDETYIIGGIPRLQNEYLNRA
ncbi:hypothetical protein C8R47DRAFT_1088438 [Mycena vitilis]|nr:hypothetical protein C8R47DRAFT_1088438 [Mycena vitilis]